MKDFVQKKNEQDEMPVTVMLSSGTVNQCSK